MSRVGVLALAMCLLPLPVYATYIITPLSSGASSLDLLPGDSFDLDVVLTSGASDEHLSAIFRVIFSSPGLSYESYDWQVPYANGTQDDDSDPLIGDLPVLLDADTLTGPGYPTGVVDVELSNVVPDPSIPFRTGTLVTLTLEVPLDYPVPETVTIGIEPDQLYHGLEEIPTTAGPDFTLHVVPEPAGLCLLIAAAAFLGRRPRRRK